MQVHADIVNYYVGLDLVNGPPKDFRPGRRYQSFIGHRNKNNIFVLNILD